MTTFPIRVKASMRIEKAKTGSDLNDCLSEALREPFTIPNVLTYGAGQRSKTWQT